MSGEIVKSPEVLKWEALRAARYAGRAGATATNLYSIGSERAQMWQAEEEVWRKRQNAALSAVPLDRQSVSRAVLEAGQISYGNNLVPLPSASS